MAQTKTKNGVTYKKSSSGRWFRTGGGKSSSGGSRVTPADYVRLGPQAAQIKAQTNPKDWANMVRAAHQQGWTVRSAVDSEVPAELKQKTQKSVRAAAQRQIDEAYKPALAELEGADAQNSGLRAKRLADQQGFDQWSAQQASNIAQKMNEAQDKYEATIKAGSDARVKDAQAVAQGFAAKAGAGGISDLSGSVANADVNRTQQATTERAHAATDFAAAQRPIVAERAAAIPMAALGSASQRHAQIEGDFAKALEGNTKARSALLTNRAADHAKAYADLMKTELDKASANRDYAGLMQQVAQKDRSDKLDYKTFLQANKTKQRGQDVAAGATLGAARIRAATAADTNAANAVQKQLDRANKIQVAKIGQAGKATGPAARNKSRTTVQAINSLAQYIRGGTYIGLDNKVHRIPKDRNKMYAALQGIGASKGQVDVAVRIVQGRKHVLYNPGALGILPEDLGSLGR